MTVADVSSLGRAVQQHAQSLHNDLSKLLNSPSDSNVSASAPAAELRDLTTSNVELARALCATGPGAAVASTAAPLHGPDDLEELQASCYQRQDLLQGMLDTLDDAVQGLRTQLDACHKLISSPPCKEEPEAILRYAHTLRHGFAPLGTAPGLMQVPPAPQLPFMLCSTLRVYNMDLAAQQQQRQQQALQPTAPPPQLPAAPAAAAAVPVEQPAPAQVLAVAPQQVTGLFLNADLVGDSDLYGEETTEEYSASEDTE